MQGSRSRLLVAWVDAVQRRAGSVLLATGAVTVAVLWYAVATLGVNTHHTAILSDDLPFWKHYHEFADVFPILDEALLVVIDAETGDLVANIDPNAGLLEPIYSAPRGLGFGPDGMLYFVPGDGG